MFGQLGTACKSKMNCRLLDKCRVTEITFLVQLIRHDAKVLSPIMMFSDFYFVLLHTQKRYLKEAIWENPMKSASW